MVGLVRATGASEVVKVKSMATQEIELNEALARPRDRRLGDGPRRAHRPARARPPVAHPGAGDPPEPDGDPRDLPSRDGRAGLPAPADLSDDPAALAEAARLHLREKFLRARVAISGANFAIAETGTVVVVESEGNGRMCLTLPETLITVMGIEKLLPRLAGPRGLPAAAAALVDRRADEPVHVDVDGRHAGRRAAGVPPGPARQRPHATSSRTRSGGRRCAASAARRASTSARSTSERAVAPTARRTRGRSARS